MTKVLIVDDHPELRNLLRICFNAAGLEVVEVSSGRKAIDAIEEYEPEIIILDVMLPDISGVEVCSAIRSEPYGANAYIIMLSARTEANDRVTGLENGADAYLTKPFEPQEVMAQLRVGLRAVEDRRNSMTDSLTGIFGRRAFDCLLEQAIARSHRYNGTLSLVMIDVDNFKIINDTCGHAAGDLALQEFAQLLREEAREADMYFRWGGEEFAWLMCDTDIAGSAIAADRFRNVIANHEFAGVGNLTASFGVAMLQLAEDGKSLCMRADRALYRAKDRGRNCVEFDEVPELAVIGA